MSEITVPRVQLDQERERTIEQLCEQYAAENLTDTELEERLAKAVAATTLPALREAVAGLPAPPHPAGHIARAAAVEDADSIVCVLASTERKGAWTLPRELKVVNVLASMRLDLREASFGSGVTTLDVFNALGSIEIVAPPGVRVVMEGTPVIGSFESRVDAVAPDADAPTLRLRGTSILGSVDLAFRYAGESGRDARRRARLARREARRLLRGR